MTQPRSILPGSTYLITRRVLRRHMLLQPTDDMTNLIVYALACAAARFGVQVHALCAMSTHLHIVATDVHGTLPRFLQSLHRIIALGTQRIRSWEGPVWDHEPASAVVLTTPESVLEKVVYTLANPVAAGLVQRAHEWPGAKVLVEELGTGVLRATRPLVYVNSKNPIWPEVVALPISPPPTLPVEDMVAFRRTVAAELDRQTSFTRSSEKPAPPAGPSGAVEPHPEDRARSPEPRVARNPVFAAGRNNREGLQRAAAALRGFRAAYRAALDQWRAGARAVLFPLGTWWMRVFHGASVNEAMDAR